MLLPDWLCSALAFLELSFEGLWGFLDKRKKNRYYTYSPLPPCPGMSCEYYDDCRAINICLHPSMNKAAE